MTIKVSDDGNAVCCGRNGPRLAFQAVTHRGVRADGIRTACTGCCAEKRAHLCLKLPCFLFHGEKCIRYGNYQEVKS
jgi:hypothetical protein